MSNHYHTPIGVGAQGNSSVVNAPLSDIDGALYDFMNGFAPIPQINLGNAPSTLTISGGEIDITNSYHLIDTQGAAASDELDTINGDLQGDLLVLRIVSNSRVVTLKHNTGNIFFTSGADITLTSVNQVIILFRAGSVWTGMGDTGGSVPAVTLPYTQVATTQIQNSSSELTLFSGTPPTLAANELTVGKQLRVRARGRWSNTSGSNRTADLRLKLGGTTVTTVQMSATNGGSQVGWLADFDIVCYATGASGSVWASGAFIGAAAGLTVVTDSGAAAVTIDTTGALALELTWQWSAAASTISTLCTILSVEILAPE